MISDFKMLTLASETSIYRELMKNCHYLMTQFKRAEVK